MAETKGTKLYEEIAAKMLAQIHDGELQPGDRLPPERTLAEDYGVSRTAIREALRSLEMMGCVSSRVGEGTFIKAPSMSNIVEPFSMVVSQNTKHLSELIEVRLILETEIAALAARRRTQEQLDGLERTLKAMEEDVAAGGNGVQADEDFHGLLAHAAGNEALSLMLDMCAGLLSKTRPITQAMKGVARMTLKDHTAIYTAVQEQDERTARRMMRNHLNRALRNLNKIHGD